MKKSFSLRDAARNVAFVLIAALVAILLTPAIYVDAAEADTTVTTNGTTTNDGNVSAKAAGVDGLWTYTTQETGQLFGSADVDGNYGTGIEMSNGKKIIFVDYITKKDFDLTDGQDYYSYRYSDINGVVTVTSRIKGVTTNKSGYFNSYGEVVIENYGWIEEIHNFDRGAWSMERYNYNGKLTARITKILSDAGNGRGIVTTTTDSETAPTTPSSSPQPFWPTTAPTASARPTVPPYIPPTTNPTVPPYIPPTTNPTVPPYIPPTQPPVATPPAQTQPPVATPPAQTQAPTVTVPPSDSQEVTPPTEKAPVSNFSSLRRSSKIEKKAYKVLKKLERKAKNIGWGEKRRYKRTYHTKKKVKTTVYLMGDFGGDSYTTFKFTHVMQKSGKKYVSMYYWKGKKVSASGVRKVIERKIK